MDPESGARPSPDPGNPPDQMPGHAPGHLSDHAPDPASTLIFNTMPGMSGISAMCPPSGGSAPRCVVLLPGVSGVDTPTVTAGVALALASVQPADVLLADLDPAWRGAGLATRFGLTAPEPGALLPVAPRLTYRPTGLDELAGPWPERVGLLLLHCGPGPTRDALDRALAAADAVLLFTPDTDAGVEAVCAALDWLGEAGRGELARGAVVAFAGDGQDAGTVFGGPVPARCRSVHRLPAAAHLVPPGVLDPEQIPDTARDTLLELARGVLDHA